MNAIYKPVVTECMLETDDNWSVSSYAAIPPASYKRAFELPQGAGTFNGLLQDITSRLDQLKVQIAKPAEGRIQSSAFTSQSTVIPASEKYQLRDNEEVAVRRAYSTEKETKNSTRHRSRPSRRCHSGSSTGNVDYDAYKIKVKDGKRGKGAGYSPRGGRHVQRPVIVQRRRERDRVRLKSRKCHSHSIAIPKHNETVGEALQNLQHYHLDMHNLPFLPSNPSGPSFNVKANVQQVIGKLKTHHPQLCQSSEEDGGASRDRVKYPVGILRSNNKMEELEKEYAAMYRRYERVKLEIPTASSRTHLRYLLRRKAAMKERLRDLLRRMESHQERHVGAEKANARGRSRKTAGTRTDRDIVDHTTQQHLLRDLRDVQKMFDKCNI